MQLDYEGKELFLEELKNEFLKESLLGLTDMFISFPINSSEIKDFVSRSYLFSEDSIDIDLYKEIRKFQIKFYKECFDEFEKGNSKINIERLKKNSSYNLITDHSDLANERFFIDTYLYFYGDKIDETDRMNLRLKGILKSIKQND